MYAQRRARPTHASAVSPAPVTRRTPRCGPQGYAGRAPSRPWRPGPAPSGCSYPARTARRGSRASTTAGPLPCMYDPSGPGRLLSAFFAAMAETERENIRESTLEGLDAAARKGKHGGRPPVITDDMHHTVLRRRTNGDSVEQIQPDLQRPGRPGPPVILALPARAAPRSWPSRPVRWPARGAGRGRRAGPRSQPGAVRGPRRPGRGGAGSRRSRPARAVAGTAPSARLRCSPLRPPGCGARPAPPSAGEPLGCAPPPRQVLPPCGRRPEPRTGESGPGRGGPFGNRGRRRPGRGGDSRCRPTSRRPPFPGFRLPDGRREQEAGRRALGFWFRQWKRATFVDGFG
ncbi:recombinase family protein [Streptomyces sp. NPDC048171]|uniref:recombinase family protein n=1 Tax=Streptomyces sp. NPDC048171 TaxID=3365504 RepID=UPI003717903C